jgi:fatty-acyl-CoA synthase
MTNNSSIGATVQHRPESLSFGQTVSELQLAALRRRPDSVGLICEGRRYTYREIEGRISQVAQLFESNGLGRGDGIAVLAANRAEVIFANWAAQSLGMRYTPLHPKGSEDDHLYILAKAKISVLVVDAISFGERGRVLAARADLKRVFALGGDFGIDLTKEADGFQIKPVESHAHAQDICNVYFTGGTTGRPKGAAHRHLSVTSATVQSMAAWDWPEEVRFLIATPISHAAGAMLTPTLMRGGEFHVLPAFDVRAYLETIERERISATFLVPSMIYDLLDKAPLENYDLSSLRMIIYGAAPISPARLQEAIERIGPKFCQLYGQTEAPNLISYLSRSDHDLTRPHLLESCGQPVPPNQVKLIKEDGTEAALDEPGEICVRGPLVMDGYWDDPEETAKAFKNGWLHTGDVARRDSQGYLYVVDRLKDMVISGGFNVFTREVEDCLAQHPAVAAAAVIGVPHARWGEAVMAFVVLRRGANVSAEELMALVREGKGAVQAPKAIEFVPALPLTAVGKVDKKALREPYWGKGRGVA